MTKYKIFDFDLWLLQKGSQCVCVFITGEDESQNKGNKYGATRSAGDYRRKVQLARCVCLYIVYWLRPRARIVTKEQNQALVEPLGPIYINFQNS